MTIDRPVISNIHKFSTDQFFKSTHQQPENWSALEAYLKANGYEFCADPPPKQFIGGFGNLNYLIHLDGKPYVLRRPPHGHLPPGANDMAREYRVTSKLWRDFSLAPRGVLLCEDKTILGASFLIMEYRPGLVIHTILPDELCGKTWTLSEMVVEVLCEFQSVNTTKVGLDDLGSPDGFLQRAVAGWIKRFHVAAGDIYSGRQHPKSVEFIIDWLKSQTIPEADHTLLHNDFKLNNIVLDPAQPTNPTALLDWDMCTRGDPLFDFATLLSYWIEPNDPPALNKVGQMPTAITSGWMSRREIADYYAKISGIDISNIHFYRVLTAFKHCIIFMQIYVRFVRGTTTDPRVAELGDSLDSLFEFTHDLVLQRYF